MTTRRTALLRQLDETLRKVGAQSVLLSDTVGRLVGINSTDLECLDLLYLSGPTTAGRLAEHTGLSTGAMTAVIDRLASALEKVATSESYRQRVTEQGAYPVFMGPRELGEFTKAELAHWGEVIKTAGITLDQ